MTTQRQDEEDLSAIHLWLVLWKAARAVEQHAHRSIAPFNMGASDFGVLEALLHKGPLTVKQLGGKVLLTSGSMTTAVDRLERRGLVVRSNDAKDRRARIISLTDAGRELISEAFTEHRMALENAVSGFSQQERAELLPLLRQLGHTAEKNF
ncbi:MAG: MarR family transcriptional regulator [Edaphobacter sp.]|uniref:MarR family winged helix-turn-helix transcriptional regulator n=1 Tax=Edaphobacter sp. TaxID=1934404 RepID=UPI002383E967|nr:MarR family transcriptional regulator [Edaphobacter sp.]MDE1178553.1 MarR family transcriptional regulator [Edaphobacter sp.]